MKNKKYLINTDKAPKAIGPYSQAVKFNNLIFTSGQIPIDPKTSLPFSKLLTPNIKDNALKPVVKVDNFASFDFKFPSPYKYPNGGATNPDNRDAKTGDLGIDNPPSFPFV